MIKIPFTQFDAAGNTWIVVASDDLQFSSSHRGPAAPMANAWFRRLARSLCHERRGPGSDGLLVILPPQHKRNLARVQFFNADGSEAEMSGNGIRCAAAWLGLKTGRVRSLGLETAAGLRVVSAGTGLAGSGSPHRERGYIVHMGRPILHPVEIPFLGGRRRGPILGFPLPTRRGEIPVTVTSMGNPHCTLFVTGFEDMNWKKLGREIETHSVFPRRTNVEFVRVISRREIEVRFWERGVGETLSSGTGSCAAVVAGVLGGRTGRRVRVRTLAGTLDVEWPRGGEVRLAGPARWVENGVARFRGSRHSSPKR